MKCSIIKINQATLQLIHSTFTSPQKTAYSDYRPWIGGEMAKTAGGPTQPQQGDGPARPSHQQGGSADTHPPIRTAPKSEQPTTNQSVFTDWASI